MFEILMLLAQSAGPAPAAATKVAQPAPVVAERPTLPRSLITYFQGRWTGSGKFVRSGKSVESDFIFEARLGGEAMLVSHAEKEPATFAYLGLLSVDSVSGDPVMLMAGNNKGGARVFRSRGWQGATLTFTAAPDLQTWFARERITFHRQSDTAFRATYEMSRDGGATWTTGDEQLFNKVA